MGPKKRHGGLKQNIKKVSILSKMMIVKGFPVTRNIFCFWGHFPKWIFAEGRSTRSPWCLEKIQGPIWRSKDHLVMKGLSKNVKNHDSNETNYSVRQKIGDAGSISTQNMFPLHSVTPKRPESPYGANKMFLAENQNFKFFSPLIPYRAPIGAISAFEILVMHSPLAPLKCLKSLLLLIGNEVPGERKCAYRGPVGAP